MMATVVFTKHLQRYVSCPRVEVVASTVAEALDAIFAEHPRMRGYVLDDQDAVRKHVMIFVDGQQVADRRTLCDTVAATSEIYVMQALSGG
jgi:molybdopterin synthase sulfur carrier subunit